MKDEFPDKWRYVNKKSAGIYETFKCIDDYQKPVKNIKREDLFRQSKNKYHWDEEVKKEKNCWILEI